MEFRPISYTFGEGLNANQHLKVLDLSYDNLVDKVLEGLTKTLWTNPQLEDLDITVNEITNEGLKTIALQNLLSSLRRLQLRSNHLITRL